MPQDAFFKGPLGATGGLPSMFQWRAYFSGERMLIKKPQIPSSEIPPKETYLNRRKFLAGAALTGAVALTGARFLDLANPALAVQANDKIPSLQKSPFSTTEKETPYKDVTNYNNFYEFSPDKYDPADLSKNSQ